MKNCLSVILICFGLTLFAQDKEKVSRRIYLMEEYTAPNFEVPQSILWYTGGNYSMEENYRSLFKRLDKKLKKEETKQVFRYDRDASLPAKLESFDQLDLKFNNNDFNALCVTLVGDYRMSDPASKKGNMVIYQDQMPEYIYQFFVILIEANTNKVLLKRKYEVRDTDMFKKDNKELVKVLAKEFTK